jgi:hypothetical protein
VVAAAIRPALVPIETWAVAAAAVVTPASAVQTWAATAVAVMTPALSEPQRWAAEPAVAQRVVARAVVSPAPGQRRRRRTHA